MRIVLASLCMMAALPAAADVYRCSAPNASVTYQQQPCDSAALQDMVPIATQWPDHVRERDRLAAREAAADARILERARIASAERIARDERAAREAAYAAERERAQEAEASYPVYVGFAPRVRPFHRHRPRPPFTH